MASESFNDCFFQYELPELMRLERRKAVMGILSDHPSIKGAEGMLLRRMSKAMYEADAEKSWEVWSEIKPQSPNQEQALGILWDDFQELHQRVQGYLETEGSRQSLSQRVMSYASPESPIGPGYEWNDRYEQRQVGRRGLDVLRNQGVSIRIPPEEVSVLRGVFEELPACPFIESTKTARIAIINGFDGSLMILTMHDLYDHFYAYEVLDRHGFFDRYKPFFAKVGNPHQTDIYKREGELIASIVFNFRAWHLKEPGVRPDITATDIEGLLRKSASPSENQVRALSLLKTNILTDEIAAEQLGYITTRVLIQLMEQRRKQGFIRALNQDYQPVGTLSLTDPEYVALITEVTNLFSTPTYKDMKALINASVLVEEYFRMLTTSELLSSGGVSITPNLQTRLSLSKDGIPQLVIRIRDLEDGSIINNSVLPKAVIDWIKNNPCNMATLQRIYK